MTQAQLFFLILLIVHLIICIVIYILTRMRIFKMSEQLFSIVLLVPIWGFFVALFAEFDSRRHLTGSKQIMLEKLHTDDYRIITMEEDTSESTVVPIEEAMLINDTETRRHLMVEVLHQDPNQFIRLLQRARMNDDLEVTHYASTTMMELQREYEIELQRCERRLRDAPDDPDALGDYIMILNKYISSGLIDETMLLIQRRRLSELLKKKIELSPAEKDTYVNAADTYLELEDYAEAIDIIEKMLERWPSDETAWIMKLKYCHITSNGKMLASVVKQIEDKNIYLSESGRDAIAFWSRPENDAGAEANSGNSGSGEAAK